MNIPIETNRSNPYHERDEDIRNGDRVCQGNWISEARSFSLMIQPRKDLWIQRKSTKLFRPRFPVPKIWYYENRCSSTWYTGHVKTCRNQCVKKTGSVRVVSRWISVMRGLQKKMISTLRTEGAGPVVVEIKQVYAFVQPKFQSITAESCLTILNFFDCSIVMLTSRWCSPCAALLCICSNIHVQGCRWMLCQCREGQTNRRRT